MRIFTISFFLLFFSSSNIYAQAWVWGKEGGGNLIVPQNSPSISADNHGNAYMTGDYFDTLVFGNDTLINRFESAYLVKYNSNGAAIWAKQPKEINSRDNSFGSSVATDNAGNVFVAGGFTDTITFGAYRLTDSPITSFAIFLVKYDSNGNVLWAHQSDFPISGGGAGVNPQLATDVLGNVFMAGEFYDTISFGLDTLKSLVNNVDNAFLVKYDANGNVLWARQSRVPANNAFNGATSVATDKLGNSFITGSFSDTISFGAITLSEPGPFYFMNVFLVKYDPNGNVLWARQSNAASSSCYGEGNSITTDNEGNTYVTGIFTDTLSFGPFSVHTSAIYITSMFLVKYNADGNVAWAEQPTLGNFNIGDEISAVSHDDSNHIYIVFMADTTSVIFGGYTFYSPFVPISTHGGVLSIAKIDTSGNVLCGSSTPSYYMPRQMNGITSDNSGNYIYTAGMLHDVDMLLGVDNLNTTPGALPYLARWETCSNKHAPQSDSCVDFTVPNVFTPNGDGKNDVFYINASTADSYSISIYNRWGNLEFVSYSPNISWDGRNSAGEEVSDGVYYYIIKSNCGGKENDKHGFLQLIR